MQIRRWIVSLAAMLSTTLALAAVDINKATEAELDGIKGIGPATTRLIVEQRKAGPFTDWADLTRRVKGIGAKRAAKLSGEGLTVNGQPFAAAADASASPAGTAKTARLAAQKPAAAPAAAPAAEPAKAQKP
ncbi:ComEA family DNA-binding protein [Diaphorobacter caeni]|uniref:ComEA family DNA-binding protein n=1 Tax=Diaphorobacter caeni TaxID=2784387 RepID=UPI00188F06DC|nr:helix-hairpin-helix domain-containing protein [Diaphorobacter caeni]MBF5006314.1 helix-hairpin-helix domain-containing protein [Diaphorobacter caeni]